MRSLSFLTLLVVLVSAAPARAERTWVYHPEPDLVREREFAYAIDGVHRQAYRFGGKIDGVLSAELKRQDLDDPDLTWQLALATPGPPARRLARAFFDARRERLLLLGGYDADSTAHADIWAWDPATGTWSQPPVGPGGPLSLLDEYPMTYDTRRDRLLYMNDEGIDQHPRVWALDLNTLAWSSFDPASTFKLLPERYLDQLKLPTISVAAYDSLGDRLFLQGGLFNDSLFVLDVPAPTVFVKIPGVEYADVTPRMAVDVAGNRLVLAMNDGLSLLSHLVTLDLSDLSSITAWDAAYQPEVNQTGVGDRDGTLAWAIDPVGGTIEVLCQTDHDLRLTLDLQVPKWTSRLSAGRIRASDDLAGAIDPIGRSIYVYGGRIQSYRNFCDGLAFTDSALFRLDADDPTQQEWLHPPGEGPGPLQGAIAVFDSIGRRVVFQGGSDASNLPHSEVWALDLDPEPHWSRLDTQSEGPARFDAGAAIDPVSRTLYLIGGDPPAPDPHPGWLWSLDLAKSPAEWTLLIAANPEVYGPRIGYDRVHRRLLGVESGGPFTIDLPPGGPPVVTQRQYIPEQPEYQQSRGGVMGAFDTHRNLMFAHGGYGSPTMTAWTSIGETGVWSGDVFRDDLASLGEHRPPTSSGLAIHDPVRDRLLIVHGDDYGSDGCHEHLRSDLGMFGVWTLDLDDAVPTVVDLADVALEPRGVRVRFSGAGADGPVHVERAIDGTLEWTWIGDARETSPELFEWFDESVVPGTTYRYRGRFLAQGAERITAISEAVHVPGTVEFALKAPGGSVGRGWPVVVEGRVTAGIAARVELVDVAGRVVSRRAVTGAFAASLVPLRPSAGIYFARLVQGDRTAVIKLVRF